MIAHGHITKESSQPIIEAVQNNIKTIFPLSVGNKTLSIKNVEVTGWDNADPSNYHAMAEAKAKDKTYGVNLVGEVELHENGKLLDKKKMKIATVPILTGDGTFIVAGSQYQIDNQLRLKPGIYSIKVVQYIDKNKKIESMVISCANFLGCVKRLVVLSVVKRIMMNR